MIKLQVDFKIDGEKPYKFSGGWKSQKIEHFAELAKNPKSHFARDAKKFAHPVKNSQTQL